MTNENSCCCQLAYDGIWWLLWAAVNCSDDKKEEKRNTLVCTERDTGSSSSEQCDHYHHKKYCLSHPITTEVSKGTHTTAQFNANVCYPNPFASAPLARREPLCHYSAEHLHLHVCVHSLTRFLCKWAVGGTTLSAVASVCLLQLLLLCRCIGGHSYCGDDDGVMMFPHSKTDCPAYSQLGVVCKCERVWMWGKCTPEEDKMRKGEDWLTI